YGYPQYSYPYVYPYGYSSDTYPDSGTTTTSPDYSSTDNSGAVSAQVSSNGALTFDVTPTSAEVWVDGNRVGVVGDFAPARQPLELTPGRHAVEIRAGGYRTVIFNADVVAGEVLPYSGTMERE